MLRSPRSLTIAAALSALGLTTAATPAAADRAVVDDPRGDVVDPGAGPLDGYDVVSAAHGHGNGTIRHVVEVAGTAAFGDPHGPVSGVRIEIDLEPGRPGDCNGNARDPLGRAELIVTPEADGGVIDCRTSGIPEMRGGVAVRARGSRLVFDFPTAAIDHPASYRWLASTGTATTIADIAPQGRGARDVRYRRHWLRPGGGGERPGRRTRRCGDVVEVGAGAYDVRARGVGCRAALRVARRFQDTADQRFAGWRCRYRRTGLEDGRVRCVKRRGGHARLVRFRIGA